MTGLRVAALGESTWDAFARLVESQNGVWGGCWCMGFHVNVNARDRTGADNRAEKEARVRSGRTHAALVFDGDDCVGWCQFGPVAELPRIKHGRAYQAGLAELPDWRITCFYVHKGHRRRGVADAALGGALAEIARLGGGTVESYPEDATDRKVSGSFLYNGTLTLFERHGFARTRRLGKNHWVAARVVPDGAAGTGGTD